MESREDKEEPEQPGKRHRGRPKKSQGKESTPESTAGKATKKTMKAKDSMSKEQSARSVVTTGQLGKQPRGRPKKSQRKEFTSESTARKAAKVTTNTGGRELAMQLGTVRNVTSEDHSESSVETKKRTRKVLTKRVLIH